MACRSYAWRLPLLMLLLCPAITLGQQVDQPATQLREKLIKLQALRVEHIELSQKLAKLQEQREHITDRFTQQIKQSQNQVQTSRQKNQRQRDDLVKIQKQIQDNLQWLIGASQIALESAANIRHPVTLSDDVQAQFNDTSKALGQQSQPTNNESHESFDAITHLVQKLSKCFVDTHRLPEVRPLPSVLRAICRSPSPALFCVLSRGRELARPAVVLSRIPIYIVNSTIYVPAAIGIPPCPARTRRAGAAVGLQRRAPPLLDAGAQQPV